MPRSLQPIFSFSGLNTKANETGLDPMDCTALQDMRVVGKDLIQRLGIVRVGQVAGTAKALDFTAASSDMLSCAVDTRPWTLGLNWTVEMALEPDSTAGTQGILTVGSTTPALILDIAATDIRLRVWDSAAALTTITVGAAATAVQTVQVTRSGATVSTRLNNGTAVTDTMSATNLLRAPVGDLRVARDNGANYYDGTVDYLRLLSYTKSNHADRLIRHPSPRAEYVLADYDFNVSAGGLTYDRSRYENHLLATNVAAGDEVTSLCHGPDPIRALSMGVEQNNRKQLLVCAGGSYYLATGD